jgi:hypothetical protein
VLAKDKYCFRDASKSTASGIYQNINGKRSSGAAHMQHFGPFSVAIAVFVFLSIATVSGIVGEYKKRQATLEVLRLSIERGQPIDPAIVDRLMAPEERDPNPNPLHFRIGGAITMASGLGVAAFAFFLAPGAPAALNPLLGISAAVLCVGIGLLITASIVERHVRRSALQGK